MTMMLQMSKDEERNLTKPEKAIVTALPTMLEGQFEKLVRLLAETGVLVAGSKEQLNMAIIADSFYAALVSVFTVKGTVEVEEAQKRVNRLLTHAMENTSFEVSEKGCGEVDCPACSSTSDEPESSEAAPVGVTKH